EPLVLAEGGAEVHRRGGAEDVAVALVDDQVEAVAAARFDAVFLAEHEVLGADLRTDAEAAELAFVRSPGRGGGGETAPAGFVAQDQAAADELPGGVEGRVAGGPAGPDAPVLPLEAPVKAQLDQAGAQLLLGLGFRILEVRRGEGDRNADRAEAGAALDAASQAEALGLEAVGLLLVLLGVEIDFLQPGAGLALRRHRAA